MAHFDRHIFFCLNQRDGGRPCCADQNAAAMQEYAKKKVKAMGLARTDQGIRPC